ncbi:FecR domain-containing protein [Bradyrhizobium sp. WSM 1704]|uniref:FecR family protein n=1 Tax=Bradyrhizobium semiaridum TaxID=2821404 RepID=UPI001CE2DAC6|nr:FecR family protein [Bradyrhizobium semiaridum]MCA6125174.1 FecR domain-containing protein [Bradyrhizobium semiaridum]
MRAHLIGSLIAGVVLALAGPGIARAQDDTVQRAVQEAPKLIGKVVAVTGSATIEHPSAVVQVGLAAKSAQSKVGDLVYLGDVVRTEADGRIAINFTDGTSFNLASNARMVMSEFVYDPNGTQNSSLLKLTKGTFTFVAGNIAKTGDMKVDTPVATMGIRGTTPHIEISDDGTTKFATLIEEGKGKSPRKYIPRAAQQPPLDLDQRYNPQICRGC